MTDEEMWVQPILFPIPEYEPIRWGEEIAAIEALCAENARLTAQLAIAREGLEKIAEERDAGRHDGLPESCPAHEDVVMWVIARQALANMEADNG